jgi:hypothetical protein
METKPLYTTHTAPWPVLALPAPPAFPVLATLYFLDGHYLYKYTDGRGVAHAKFVTAPDLAAAFSGAEQDSGWLPAGVVRAGHGPRGPWFVYSAPAQKVALQIEGEAQPLQVPIPRTVLLGVGQTYYLWALAAKVFGPDAAACKAPFPNVYSDGRICWGTNLPPAADPQKARQAWELFFATPFNRHLVDGKSLATPQDVLLELRTLASVGAHHYLAQDLVTTHRTITQLVAEKLEA